MDRRGLATAVVALAAAGSAGLPREAKAQWAVFDAANFAQVLQELAQVSELLAAANDTKNKIGEVNEGIGSAVDLASAAPEIANALAVLEVAGEVCREVQGLFGARSRGGSKVALGLPYGLYREGDICSAFDAPAKAMEMVRQEFEPVVGAEIGQIQQMTRRRTAEYRRAVYAAMGTSYHTIGGDTKCYEQLKSLGGLMRGGTTLKRLQAAGNAVNLATLEEIQTLNRQFSAFLRLQAARELKDESVENYQHIPENV